VQLPEKLFGGRIERTLLASLKMIIEILTIHGDISHIIGGISLSLSLSVTLFLASSALASSIGSGNSCNSNVDELGGGFLLRLCDILKRFIYSIVKSSNY
jgi:hypothetical protein